MLYLSRHVSAVSVDDAVLIVDDQTISAKHAVELLLYAAGDEKEEIDDVRAQTGRFIGTGSHRSGA